MDKYVIITPTLSNMGGAQMYVRNKALYLQNAGWDVFVFAADGYNVLIPELRQFEYFFPELNFNKYECSKKTQQRVVASILTIIGKQVSDKVTIESTSIVESVWGEAIARLVGAKHIVFLLQEKNINFNKGILDYLIFKHHRREVAGINKKSLYNFFKPFYPIEEETSYRLNASCNNVEADVDHPLVEFISKKSKDYVVGLFSRLDKPYVQPTLESFKCYIQRHKNVKFILLLIGSAPNAMTIDKVYDVLGHQENLDVIITGYLFPVPTKLLELCNVFLSAAGSSRVCARSGIPTITFDANDSLPIGVLGYTTKNTVFRGEDEKPIELSALLDDILFKKVYRRIESNYYTGIPNFMAHTEFIAQSCQDISYYNVDTISAEYYRSKDLLSC